MALVSASGLVTAVGSGQATIVFDAATRRASTVIRVVPNFGANWTGTYDVTVSFSHDSVLLDTSRG